MATAIAASGPEPATPETPLDRYLFRPIADGVVRLFLPMPLSDVGLTLLGVAIAIGGASMFRFTSGTNVVGGSLLMALYVVLSRAGGGLAQIRGTASRFGWIVSVLGDYVVGLAFIPPLAIHLDRLKVDDGAPLAVAAMLSVLFQGMLFDYFRNRYLVYAAPGGPNGNDLVETREALAELERQRAAAPTIALHRVYVGLRRAQEAVAGVFDRAPFMMPASVEAAPAYAARLGVVARLWALLGPSSHFALLGVFACTGNVTSYVGLRLTLFNALAVGLFWEHYRRERAHMAAVWG